jgi:5'-methylthioadenosine phosphorylase
MIGIIGGYGLHESFPLENVEEKNISTKFGNPSSPVIAGTFQNQKVAFLSRHGKNHSINPTNINYRANINAFKQLGVTHIIAVSAVGSLQSAIHPGELVVLDQFIDRTTKRVQTFYDEEKVCHISTADPFCPQLRSLLIEDLQQRNVSFHSKGTYVCIEGPRFSTKAESKLFQSWNAQVIGMTLVPEAVLAREAEICFVSVALVTDYDSFKETPVSFEEVLRTVKKNSQKSVELLENVIPKISNERDCACGEALKNSFV